MNSSQKTGRNEAPSQHPTLLYCRSTNQGPMKNSAIVEAESAFVITKASAGTVGGAEARSRKTAVILDKAEFNDSFDGGQVRNATGQTSPGT